MQWQLIGPKIPIPVWYSHLLRARGFASEEKGVIWSTLKAEDYTEISGRVLLLVHGTGLRTQACFLGLTQDEFNDLYKSYDGCILAFEHCALSHHLDRNSQDLATALALFSGGLELDVVGLSRGGLVVRRLVEGWTELRKNIEIRRLIFISTPNDGTPSARRDKVGSGAREMKAWRKDVRRLGLVDQREREIELWEDPFSLRGLEDRDRNCLTWPILQGTQDQVPSSPMLQILNGFCGRAPFPKRETVYFAVTSVFTFEYGAPNVVLSKKQTREEITDWALFQVPNDLVVPTSGVYAPKQGVDASGLFPLARERLVVLHPSCNATHVGVFRIAAVRKQIRQWLEG